MMGTISDKEALKVVPKLTTCPDFNSPQKHGTSKYKCSTCDGRGIIIVDGGAIYKARMTCSSCMGLGVYRVRSDRPNS